MNEKFNIAFAITHNNLESGFKSSKPKRNIHTHTHRQTVNGTVCWEYKWKEVKNVYDTTKCILLKNCKLILPLHQACWSLLWVYWDFFLSKT